MKLRLTDMAIKKLPLPEGQQVTHWDELTPGFGLRCSKKSKSFVVMYGERRQLKTLGRYPNLSLAEARTAAKRFFVEFEAGAAAKPSISFTQAKDRFLEDSRARNKPRTAADYERLLNKHFNAAGDLRDITRQQVMKVVSGLADTPSEQSHAYVVIRTMMNWCVRHGLIDFSVVPTIKLGGEARNRFLSETELAAVLKRAEETPYPFGPIIQLLIYTGQRRSEIGQLLWAWVSDDLIVFPEGFAKNKREHQFPVTPLVYNVLRSIPEKSDFLFPAATDPDKPFSGWAWHKARFDEKLEGVAPYTLHDLRRTFATIHAKIGTPIHVTERLLNHVSGTVSGVAAVYNRHSYLPEMLQAQLAYERALTDILEG
ncbi:MAG: tyrosine-type recombinase/integrase [Pseudomonadota bacterium]